jgi:hypothetical protein
MAITNPIIPPGSPLQRNHPDRNSKLFVTVFAIVAVHAFVLSGLLIQGCKREDKTTSGNSLPDLPQAQGTSAQPTPPVQQVPSATQSPDTFSVHTDAVPPLTPAVPSAAPTTPSAPTPTPQRATVTEPAPPLTTVPKVADPTVTKVNRPRVDTGGGPGVYSVKAGDTLTRIAKAHGTTVRALRAANNLKTDRLLVGQKLKLPEPQGETNIPPMSVPADLNSTSQPGGSTPGTR